MVASRKTSGVPLAVRMSRIKIANFANFSVLEVSTDESLVIVGENKVGKSNLVFALQLILDPSSRSEIVS